jgi:23S rRNA pseudouridine1911/1915/1917 synthase
VALKKISYKKYKIPVVYQDRDLIVVNKPAGLLTVPIPKSKSPNLEDALKQVLRHQSTSIKAAHRIDRYTSGLVVFAKNVPAHKNLVEQFKSQKPTRIYRALVWGNPKEEATLTHYLKRITDSFKNIVTHEGDEEGTKAVLSYRTLARYADSAIVEIQLDTGLKNQIRAQMSEMGLPMVGERQYADLKPRVQAKRQMLHAYRLEFDHPVESKRVETKCDAPHDFTDALNKLKERK